MAAREWAALTSGDVVSLGRRVGEAVVLRVGGVPVARGDLVEIDGEVGVRIVERLADDVARR
jgi:flagellar motor switch/type III secretory pathway protein FliN